VVLPPDVAAEIAAGEVIERPASVVKELAENALDAGATTIAIEIERAGLGLIRVTDDGCGMTAQELAVAIQRHATSKLRCADDLRGVLTLGFRGEGLPSMAAAADLTIRSRVPGDPAGAIIEVLDGAARPSRPAGTAVGTSVTVRDLFGRQPARRKFLRTPSGETAQIAQIVTHLALAYPQVRFSLSVDGRRTFETSGSSDLRDVAARAFGVAAAARLLELSGAGLDRSVHVSGLVSPPDLSRPTRAGIALFVNGRWIQSRRLVYAVESGYETLLGSNRHPIAVVDIRLPPEDLDVNVHPAKAEVRFRDERAVFAAIQHAVRLVVIGDAPLPQLGGFAGDSSGDGIEPAPAEEIAPQLWEAPLSPEQASGEPVRPATRPLMPLLRVIGQMGTTYVIAEGPDGMYLIDQHAAHERVLYERILAQQAVSAPEIQGLLTPAIIDVTPAQAAAFNSAAGALQPLGFDVESFGDGALAVRAVPVVLAGRDVPRAVVDLLDALAAPDTAPVADRAPMTLACHAALRAGMTLSLDEMRELVRLLETCAAPRTCPHGRPTMMHLSAAALDREFRRGR
ncbi:MAG: DNA mismatch repair endonuclease MutL, partial [Dehalococcoidia bacterium]